MAKDQDYYELHRQKYIEAIAKAKEDHKNRD